MKQLHKKLKSRRGASLVFALLVVALCALAGIVALVAAAANAGRYTHLVQEERQYLSVASALDVLQGQLDTAEDPRTVAVDYTVVETWQYDGTPPALNKTSAYTLTLHPASLPATDLNYFQKLLLLYCVPDEWFANTVGSTDLNALKADALRAQALWPPAGGAKTYTVALQNPSAAWADTLYGVAVAPVPEKPIEAALTGTEKPDLGRFALKMALAAKPKTTDISSSVYALTAVWGAEIDTKTDTTTTTAGDPATGVGTRTTTTTLTCTLRWRAENRTVTLG